MRHAYNDAQIRVVKYYDNIRFVYEIESKLRELKRANDSGGARAYVSEERAEKYEQKQYRVGNRSMLRQIKDRIVTIPRNTTSRF